MGTTSAVALPNSNLVSELLPDWCRALRAGNKQPTTIKTYTDSVNNLVKYALRMNIRTLDHKVIQTFLSELTERTSAGYSSIHYRSLQQFFKWLSVEEEIANPMVKVSPITVPIEPVDVISDSDFAKLLKVSDFRDRAVLMLMKSSGVRVGELVGMNYEDLDLTNQAVEVLGKGRKKRLVPFDDLTASAVSKYLRRTGHPRRGPLWLGRKGPLSRSGVAQMVARRSKEAGLPRVHPHQLRHTWANMVMSAGLRDGDIQSLAGWSSPQMLNRYGASLRQVRAIESYRKIFGNG